MTLARVQFHKKVQCKDDVQLSKMIYALLFFHNSIIYVPYYVDLSLFFWFYVIKLGEK